MTKTLSVYTQDTSLDGFQNRCAFITTFPFGVMALSNLILDFEMVRVYVSILHPCVIVTYAGADGGRMTAMCLPLIVFEAVIARGLCLW